MIHGKITKYGELSKKLFYLLLGVCSKVALFYEIAVLP